MYDIVSDTPIWVWVMLALLVNRGVSSLTTTTLTLQRLLLLPVIFSVWSCYAIHIQLSDGAAAYEALALSTLIAGLVSLPQFRQARGVTFDRRTLQLTRAGTPAVLLLSLAGFAVRYGLGVTLAFHPTLPAMPGFAIAYGALSGLATGALWGMALGHLAAGLRSGTPPGGIGQTGSIAPPGYI